jgi:hypothetical protein
MMLVDHLGRPIMAEQYQGGALSRHRRSEGLRNPRPYDEDRVVGAYKLNRLREQCLALLDLCLNLGKPGLLGFGYPTQALEGIGHVPEGLGHDGVINLRIWGR